MKPGHDEGHALARSFHQLLLRLARQSRRDLKMMSHDPGRYIHALRTRMKKLSAIVHLVGPRLPARSRRAILNGAKRLKNAFAPHRDAQVAAEMGFASGPTAIPRTTGPLLDEITRLCRRLESEPLDGLTREELRDAYVETYRKGRKHMKACLEERDPARLHAWRKPVKDLYYQSLALHRAPGMSRRIRRARRLGRWLGKDHDWQLVLERRPGKAGRIRPKQERLRRRLFKLAGRLYAFRQKKIARQLDPP